LRWLLALAIGATACSPEDSGSSMDEISTETPSTKDDSGTPEPAELDAGAAPCGGRAQPLAGLTAEGSAGLSLEMKDFSSDPPIPGDNSWEVRLEVAGEPLVDAKEGIVVAPTMPDHGHGTSVEVGVSEVAPGTYRFEPVNTFMVGFWQIDVSIDTDDVMGSVQFGVCVE
jgi:hypothetical protein